MKPMRSELIIGLGVAATGKYCKNAISRYWQPEGDLGEQLTE
jgi:hypothetical protein